MLKQTILICIIATCTATKIVAQKDYQETIAQIEKEILFCQGLVALTNTSIENDMKLGNIEFESRLDYSENMFLLNDTLEKITKDIKKLKKMLKKTALNKNYITKSKGDY
jgi:hypothetical protein